MLSAIVVAIVAILTVVAPGALMGSEWLRTALAEDLAQGIVDALHGTVSSLPKDQERLRVLTWVRLVMWIKRQSGQEGEAEQLFRAALVRAILYRVVRVRMPELKEAIEVQLDIERNN